MRILPHNFCAGGEGKTSGEEEDDDEEEDSLRPSHVVTVKKLGSRGAGKAGEGYDVGGGRDVAGDHAASERERDRAREADGVCCVGGEEESSQGRGRASFVTNLSSGRPSPPFPLPTRSPPVAEKVLNSAPFRARAMARQKMLTEREGGRGREGGREFTRNDTPECAPQRAPSPTPERCEHAGVVVEEDENYISMTSNELVMKFEKLKVEQNDVIILKRHTFSNVLSILPLYCKHTRALTAEFL